MQNKKIAGLLLGLSAGVLGCGAALAQELPEGRPPPDAPGEGAGPGGLAGPLLPPLPGGGGDRMFLLGRGPGGGGAGPSIEVIHTLGEMEHLYRSQGRNKEVVALYQDVLARTKDPMVRHFAYEAIVRAQLQPVDTDKALATLKQSLDDSLQRLNQPPPPGPGKGDKTAVP